ncbi:methyltransferase domain-containing protein [Streptomyces sp. NBC_00059]|uniref:class I SAM-dependent methyltransferase n=1 Tax=Streptomyces sp. NBC_00059 TaxID=2975635 RepID=UPI002255F246|nr:methyltransferase domain-containing protein [Streptomyces sp. NBC_00059]MCX5418086.1 methyltransferase domain-containing protein [Streptomyces sp. NBC_00059]
MTVHPAAPSLELLREQIAALLQDPATGHGLARTLRATAKEIEISRYHQASSLAWPNGRIDTTPERVQIGGGAHRIDGFFNIDAVPPADLLWDIREGIPLHDASVQLMFSEHFLEHIDYPRSVKHYAREAHRVLTDGGQLVTGVPDAAFLLKHYPANPELAAEMVERWYSKRDCLGDISTFLDLINYTFRDQDDTPNYTPHLWAYDEEKLIHLFTEAGFRAVEPWDFDATMANPKRQWGSVYLVAKK